MKIQLCQRCQQDTQHRVEPVNHHMSEDAYTHTCTQCGFVTTIVPYIENLTVNVSVSPENFAAGAILLRAANAAENGKPFDAKGEINIQINSS